MIQEGSLTIATIDCSKFPDQTGELTEILDLMSVVHPHLQRSLDWLRWQFFETPAGSGRIYLIKEQDKIVSICCARAVRIQSGDQVVSGRLVQDVMTHPHFRGRGHCHRLVQQCTEDLISKNEIIYAFPNQSSRKIFLSKEWKVLCPVPTRSKNLADWTRSTDEKTVSELTTPFDSTVSKIWKEAGFSTAVIRDAEYLNWRYRKPNQIYHRFLIEKDKGLVVLKLYDEGQETIANICELFVRAPDLVLVRSALQFCQQFAVQNGVRRITAWLPPQHPYAAIFEEEGFGLVRTDRDVLVVPTNNQDLFLNDSWYLSLGDNDVF